MSAFLYALMHERGSIVAMHGPKAAAARKSARKGAEHGFSLTAVNVFILYAFILRFLGGA